MPSYEVDYPFEPDQVVNFNGTENNSTLESDGDIDADFEDPVLDNGVDLESSGSEGSGIDDLDDGQDVLVVDDPKSSLNPLTRFLFNFATICFVRKSHGCSYARTYHNQLHWSILLAKRF